jgi:hypothetical protein
MAVNRERKMVGSEVATLNLNYSSLGSALDEIKDLIESHGKDAMIQECESRWDPGKYLAVIEQVPEDDAQYNRRIKLEEQMEEILARREKEEYARLKKKFGR